MFFSFIVPVYKTEQYIDKCVSTLLTQDIDDYEILLIDDGSPDEAGIICDEMGKKNCKIKVFHKENEGLGFARNYGLERAKGRYIIFIDSDDYFAENSLGRLKQFLKKYDLDISIHRYAAIKNEEVIKLNENRNQIPGKLVSGKELAQICIGPSLKEDQIQIGTVWSCVWKKAFLEENHIKFMSERIYLSEDSLFSLEAFWLADRVSFYNQVLYYYVYNQDSLTHTYNPKRVECALNRYEYFDVQIEQKRLGSKAKQRNENNLMISVLVVCHQISNLKIPVKERIGLISETCKNHKLKDIISQQFYYDKITFKLLHYLTKKGYAHIIFLLMKLRYRNE